MTAKLTDADIAAAKLIKTEPMAIRNARVLDYWNVAHRFDAGKLFALKSEYWVDVTEMDFQSLRVNFG